MLRLHSVLQGQGWAGRWPFKINGRLLIKVNGHSHADQGNRLMGKASSHAQPQLGLSVSQEVQLSRRFLEQGDTTILLVTHCSLSGKLIYTASPQGSHVAKMAASSSSGPPAALLMTSPCSLPTHPISCQPRFQKRQDKSPMSTAAALAHCADNRREISGTKQSGTLQHPTLCSIKLRVPLSVDS